MTLAAEANLHAPRCLSWFLVMLLEGRPMHDPARCSTLPAAFMLLPGGGRQESLLGASRIRKPAEQAALSTPQLCILAAAL